MKGFPFLSHHGAIRGVTGSCHQLHFDEHSSLLVDCGLEQGADTQTRANGQQLGFSVQGIEALIVTRVHLDHVGRIPALLAAGFHGPILCSEPSARLLPLVLEDAYKLGISSDPLQVSRFIEHIHQRIVPLPFGQWHPLIEREAFNCRIRLQRAGHLLGSAYVECEVEDTATGGDTRIVFSGDLGAPCNPLLRSVVPPERADILVLESTYGDRLHPDRSQRQQQLEAVIDRALADQGTIMIPAFSLGRTQELLYEIEDILYRKVLLKEEEGGPVGEIDPIQAMDWSQLPVILDSPLANRVTQAYRDLHQYWNREARQRRSEGRAPLGFRQLISIDTHAKHQQVVNYLKSTGRPAIVIAGNGMCSGGRIVNYLKAMLGDVRHEVVFVGYQVKGTPGAAIQASGRTSEGALVEMNGQAYEVLAKVVSLTGYSGHADQAGLVAFAIGMQQPPSEVVLVHGEGKAKNVLAAALQRRFGQAGLEVNVTIPGSG